MNGGGMGNEGAELGGGTSLALWVVVLPPPVVLPSVDISSSPKLQGRLVMVPN
jgi:hypothetical protein